MKICVAGQGAFGQKHALHQRQRQQDRHAFADGIERHIDQPLVEKEGQGLLDLLFRRFFLRQTLMENGVDPMEQPCGAVETSAVDQTARRRDERRGVDRGLRSPRRPRARAQDDARLREHPPPRGARHPPPGRTLVRQKRSQVSEK